MKQTIYTCDWCDNEIIGDRCDIKHGKLQFHMCIDCYMDLMRPVVSRINDRTADQGREESGE